MKKLFVLIFLLMILSVTLVVADHDEDDDNDYDVEHDKEEFSHSDHESYNDHNGREQDDDNNYDDEGYDDEGYDNWDISDDFIITTQDLSLLNEELTPIPDVPVNKISDVIVKIDDFRFVELANRIDLFLNHSIFNNSNYLEPWDDSVVLKNNYFSDVAKKSFFQRLIDLFGGK